MEADWLRESSGKQLFVSAFCGAPGVDIPIVPDWAELHQGKQISLGSDI